jgi:retron-type reverse transcriptase
MDTHDPYLALGNFGRLQRQAGVDPAIAEVTRAYALLCLNAGQPIVFDPPPFPSGSVEENAFRRLEQQHREIDARFLRFLAAYAALFLRRELPVLFTVAELARAFDCSSDRLQWIAANARASYRPIDIPKPDGRVRRVLAPSGALRDMQRWILHRILNRSTAHDCAHAFRRGRSIASNAARHTRKSTIIRLDLEDFFPSIELPKVRAVFVRLGYPYSVALALSRLCTVQGRLPQGAPTSPAVSNLVCGRMDRRLTGLAQRLDFDYTRYADDLIFSSNDPRLPQLIPLLKQVVEEEGYRVNERKLRIMRQSARQLVTGVVTNERPTLPREHRRRLRAALHRLHTEGPTAVQWAGGTGGAHTLQVLRGHLAFLRMIDPERCSWLTGVAGHWPEQADASDCHADG